MNININKFIAPLFGAMAVLLMIAGCTRNVYLPSESTYVDSTNIASSISEFQMQKLIEEIRNTRNVRDSIIIRDSTVIIINERGDTISREIFRERDRTKISNEIAEIIVTRYDSIFKAQHDELLRMAELIQRNSVPVPVERDLTWWERTKQEVGGVAIGILVAVIAVCVMWLARKMRSKFTLKGT